PVLRQRVELQIDQRPAIPVEQPRLGHGDDTVDAAQTSLLGCQSLAHEFDDQKRAADFDVRLTASRRSGRADGVVTVLTGADDGRISDAARDFPRPAAGSGY